MPKKTNAAPVGESSSTKIRASDLKNLRDLKAISKVLERLRPVGGERDAAGNRQLYMNDYCLLVLLWLFNPIVDSLRGLQQASDLDVVRKRLGVGRASLGSLSESVSIFDPEPLQAIVEEWSEKLPMRVPTGLAPSTSSHSGRWFRVSRSDANRQTGMDSGQARQVDLRIPHAHPIRGVPRFSE